MKVLKVAVVGLGWVAQNRHIPQILKHQGFELYGLIDRREGRAKKAAEKFGATNFAQTAHLGEVPWLDAVDLIVCAAAPSDHADLVIEALGAGKDVLTEKPFAMNRAEADAMMQAAQASGRTLAVVHNFQFSHAMKSLDRDIANGRIGDITGVNGVQLGNPGRRLPVWYEELPLGLFYDESPHLIYLLDRLADAPLTVKRVEVIDSLTGMKTPAQVNVTMMEDGGKRPFTIRCNFEAPLSEWHVMVIGSKSMAVVDVFRDIYVRLPNDGTHTAWPVLRTSLTATVMHWWQVVTRGIGHVTKRLHYGNDEIYSRLYDGLTGAPERLTPINVDAALRVLNLQQTIIEMAEKDPT